MSCDAIRLAMADFDACEPTLDGSRIATHCLYPSFESVHVYVVKEGETFVVHDGKGAFNSAWGHARDDKLITAAVDKEAHRFHLRNDNNRLVVSDVPGDWLRSAILAVANASAAAATSAVARVIAVADEALVAKIDKTLTATIAPSRIARNFAVRGASGGNRKFDFAIRGADGYDLFVNGVTSHHSSYFAKYVAFSDVEVDRSNKIAIRDEELKTDVESLMLKVATIVPLVSIGHSKVGAYALGKFETVN